MASYALSTVSIPLASCPAHLVQRPALTDESDEQVEVALADDGFHLAQFPNRADKPFSGQHRLEGRRIDTRLDTRTVNPAETYRLEQCPEAFRGLSLADAESAWRMSRSAIFHEDAFDLSSRK